MLKQGPVHVSFNPFCDYPLISIARVFSFYQIPIVTTGAYGSVLGDKTELELQYLTRVSTYLEVRGR